MQSGGLYIHPFPPFDCLPYTKSEMEIFTMKESWTDFSKRLRQRFSKLTHDDVTYIRGKEEDTLNRISDRLGKTREEVILLFKKIRLGDDQLN
jgi:hypothetical protein